MGRRILETRGEELFVKWHGAIPSWIDAEGEFSAPDEEMAERTAPTRAACRCRPAGLCGVGLRERCHRHRRRKHGWAGDGGAAAVIRGWKRHEPNPSLLCTAAVVGR